MNSSNAIALLSAGLDSSIALAMAIKAGTEVLLCLTFDYGQRAAKMESNEAKKIADYFQLPHKILVLPWFKQFNRGGNLLKPTNPLPQPQSHQLSDNTYTKDSAKAVWVPNRNGVFIEIGAAFAEDLGISSLIVGFNAEEAETFPDNSRSYMEAINQGLWFSTQNHVKVHSPTIALNKREIVKKALELDFPLNLLWSCYESGEKMCGLCESCQRLKRAFQQNGATHDFFAN